MTLKDFISNNREGLERCVSQQIGRVPKEASCYCPLSGTNHQHAVPRPTRKELREWILNDESLYRWARSEGVRI